MAREEKRLAPTEFNLDLLWKWCIYVIMLEHEDLKRGNWMVCCITTLHGLLFQNNEYMQSVARCLQMMLRIDEYRFAFVAVDGIATLLAVLKGRVNFQVQYQLIFCLWVLTFNPLLAEKMNKWACTNLYFVRASHSVSCLQVTVLV